MKRVFCSRASLPLSCRAFCTLPFFGSDFSIPLALSVQARRLFAGPYIDQRQTSPFVRWFAHSSVALLVAGGCGAPSALASYSELNDIRLGYHSEKFRVVFDLDRNTGYTIFTLDDPQRLVLDFSGTRMLPSVRVPRRLHDNIPVKKLRTGVRNSEDLRIVFDLDSRVRSHHFTLENPPRLVVDIYIDDWAAAPFQETEKFLRAQRQIPIVLSDAALLAVVKERHDLSPSSEKDATRQNKLTGVGGKSETKALEKKSLETKVPVDNLPLPSLPIPDQSLVVDKRSALDVQLLEYSVKHFVLDEVLPAYYAGGLWWLDFEAFVGASEFFIEKQDSGQWQGLFFNNDHHLLLDPNTMQVAVDKQPPESLDEQALLEIDGRMFVALDKLQQWFGIEFLADFRQQSLKAKAAEAFPVEQREQRYASQNLWSKKSETPVVLPDRYHWLSYPQLYIQSQLNHSDTNSQGRDSANLSVTGSMDFLKQQLFYTGSVNDSSGESIEGTQRATLSRYRDRANGWLVGGLSRYELGDVYSVSNNLSSLGGRGQGISLVRQQQSGSVSQGSTDIIGNAPPGWDVELYHHGQLLGFSSVGADGRYRFEGQNTEPGKNEFTVRLYGPQGQYEVQEQLVWGGGLDLDVGEYSYRFDLVDYTQSLLNGEMDDADSLAARKNQSAGFSYGLHRNLQLGLGYVDSVVAVRGSDGAFSDERYWSGNFRANLGSGVLLGEYNQQQDKGGAWQASYLGNLGKHSYSLTYQNIDQDFDSARTVRDNLTDSRVDVSLFGQTKGLLFDSYSLKLTERNLSDGVRLNEINNRLSRHIGNSYVSHELRYTDSSIAKESYNGTFKVSGRYQNYSFNAELGYEPQQAKPLTIAKTKVRWQINPKVFSSVQLSKQLRNQRTSQINGDITWGNKYFDVSFSASANTDNYWSMGLGISSSLGYNRHERSFYSRSRSLAQQGRLAFNVYVDDNQNNQLDEGEPLLSEVNYRDQQASSLSLSRYLSIVDVPSQNEYQLDTDKITLEDPYLVATNRYYSVYTHAGSDLTFNLPVQHTGDIEGQVLSYQAEQPSGEHVVAKPGTEIELYDKDNKLVAKTTAEYDGYYSFNTMPVGRYRVVTRSTQKFFQQHERFFTLDKEDNYQEVDDMIHY